MHKSRWVGPAAVLIAILVIGAVALASGAAPSFVFNSERPNAPAPAGHPGGSMLGDDDIESRADSNLAGNAQAWSFTASAYGMARSIAFYVDSRNAATTLSLGVYSDAGRSPGNLLGVGSVSSVKAGAWNSAGLSKGIAVRSGTRYWLAVLGSGGQVSFRDDSAASDCSTVTSSSSKLSSLPATFRPGKLWQSFCPASFYVSRARALALTPRSTTAPPNAAAPATSRSTAVARGSVSGNFTIRGTKIIAPDGSTFIPVGANMNGQDSWWSAPTAGSCGNRSCLSYAQVWGWNTIRLNTCQRGGCSTAVDGCGSSCDYLQGALPREVRQYTRAHIVTMIERHDYTTGAETLPRSNPSAYRHLINWWLNLARRYKNNPYVWFNLLNEPLGITAGKPQQEFSYYRHLYGPIIRAIRATGAHNIVVLDGVGSGQDSYDWSCSNRNYQIYSANINAAPALERRYGNILPSVHVYNQWGGGNNANCTRSSLESAFVGYIKAVHHAGVPLIVGETGDQQNCSQTANTYSPGQCAAALVAFDCAHKYGVGLLYWHGQMAMPLVTNGGGFDSINSMTNPTNLSTYNMPGWDQGWGGGKSLWGLGHGVYTSCTS